MIRKACEALSELAQIAATYDKDGIDIHFLNHTKYAANVRVSNVLRTTLRHPTNLVSLEGFPRCPPIIQARAPTGAHTDCQQARRPGWRLYREARKSRSEESEGGPARPQTDKARQLYHHHRRCTE